MISLSDTINWLNEELPGLPFWIQDYVGNSAWDWLTTTLLPGLPIAITGWAIATWMERRHLRKLDLREKEFSYILLTTVKRTPANEQSDAVLLTGSTVIAHDFFRKLIISLQRIIGGNITPYERLITRGRRAAIIRLKQEAHLRGIDRIINIRFGASALTGKPVKGVEIIAYGTGIKSRD